ncbi:type VI secretion system baseplate subunit TssE [Vibrio sp. TRT 21S02]|uniref:type VI secretion system baseplate subunit TssE n=1 Tax=unclassified Vibrio TaxID=2614977 RepID=UPI003CF030BA
MSFWRTFVAQSSITRDAEIDDIKYNLTKLFESEAPLMDIDDRLSQTLKSNLRFGIEDIQLLSANLDQTQLSMRIADWIKHFEPRLSSVMVELIERKENENALAFHIIAQANTQNGKKELIFDSKISLSDLTTSMEEDSYD